MKRIITKLRIAGLVTFGLFMISCMVQPPEQWQVQFNRIQSTLILATFTVYAVIIGLWLYEAYAATFPAKEDHEE